MLHVKTPEEALAIFTAAFPACPEEERAPLSACRGRVLFRDVCAEAYVPGFSRSTVDGYALAASDTFGCTEAVPALLSCIDPVDMGKPATVSLHAGQCAAIPTGGMLPPGADAVQMLEYCEAYGDGVIGVQKPVAPGNNVIFRGDDVSPGQTVLPKGRRLRAQDIGALAACGVVSVPVCRRPVVGVISTGDELVPVTETPAEGRIRDVNGMLLSAQAESYGAVARVYGIVPDTEELLLSAVRTAVSECDIVLLSGGSSVGEKDAAARVLSALGEILFHGVAIKPGKPTLLCRASGKPVVGLPGHPAAASMVTRLFVRPLIFQQMGAEVAEFSVPAVLTESVSANAGRAVVCSVKLVKTDAEVTACPIRGKSGLITTLSSADGYFVIPRDQEGAAAGDTVAVTLLREE